MKLVTWNVNSIRARLDRVLAWLASRQPDIVCLQETKTDDSTFPYEPLGAVGYEAVHHGQKTYNGVAILTKKGVAATDVERGFGDGGDESQSRFVAATVEGLRVMSAYIPNGGEPESPKFPYKLEWLARLRRHLDARYQPGQPLVLCGDFNVAPEERDVHDPKLWEGTVLYRPEVRTALAEVVGFGFVDAFRQHDQAPGKYSWWDYRMLGFPKNNGLRIDHVFVTAPVAERTRGASIDREERKGKSASDHAPVVVELEWP